MSLPRGEIFIGDLVTACAAIGTEDRETVEAVADMLGFSLSGEGAVRPRADEPRVAQTTTRADEQGRRKETPEIKPERLPALPRRGGPLRKYPRASFSAGREEEPKIEFGHRYEEPDRTRAGAAPSDWGTWAAGSSGAAGVPHEPLLERRWTRGILGGAAATLREGTTPDIGKAVEVIARGGELERLPTLKVPTIARGCQVLCDVNPGMMPFASDRREILDAIRSVVGRELVGVFYFEDCPVYGVEREEDLEFVPYEPPPRGTPVLIISDLGVAESPYSMRRASPAEWSELIYALRAAGCPALALTPYPSGRWPDLPSGGLRIIQWDRRTTAAAVRRARERG
jgi:hypothetical protein